MKNTENNNDTEKYLKTISEVHAVQNQMLIEYIDICKKLRLKYYLIGGSALGAQHYQGFVPWDDDIDVGMPRDDYEVFIKKAQKLLPKHLFLQNYITDPKYPLLFSKIRNSNTTMIEKTWEHLDINHGIYIDIFPLDGYPEKTISSVLYRLKLKYYKVFLAITRNRETFDYSFSNLILQFIYKVIGKNLSTQKILIKTDNVLKSCKYSETEKVVNFGNKMGKKEIVLKEYYGVGKEASFEGISVTVPEKIELFLNYRFGPFDKERKKSPSHKCSQIDVKKSYKEYIN